MKIVNEAINEKEPMEVEDKLQGTVDNVMAKALQDEETMAKNKEVRELVDPMIRAHEKPFLGAEKQETPKEVELPKIELDEALFEENELQVASNDDIMEKAIVQLKGYIQEWYYDYIMGSTDEELGEYWSDALDEKFKNFLFELDPNGMYGQLDETLGGTLAGAAIGGIVGGVTAKKKGLFGIDDKIKGAAKGIVKGGLVGSGVSNIIKGKGNDAVNGAKIGAGLAKKKGLFGIDDTLKGAALGAIGGAAVGKVRDAMTDDDDDNSRNRASSIAYTNPNVDTKDKKNFTNLLGVADDDEHNFDNIDAQTVKDIEDKLGKQAILAGMENDNNGTCLNEDTDTFELSKEELGQLRDEVILGSLYTNDYKNSFGIPEKAVQDFFDGFLEYLEELMEEDGHTDAEFWDVLDQYDNVDNLYNWYNNLESPFGEMPTDNESIEEAVGKYAELTDNRTGESVVIQGKNNADLRKNAKQFAQHHGGLSRYEMGANSKSTSQRLDANNNQLNEEDYEMTDELDDNAFSMINYTANAMKKCGLSDEIGTLRARAVFGNEDKSLDTVKAVCQEYIDRCNEIANEIDDEYEVDGLDTVTDTVDMNESNEFSDYVGKKIKIVRVNNDDSDPMYQHADDRYAGKEGVVTHVDDAGQLHGTWGGIGLFPNHDEFEIIG